MKTIRIESELFKVQVLENSIVVKNVYTDVVKEKAVRNISSDATIKIIIRKLFKL